MSLNASQVIKIIEEELEGYVILEQAFGTMANPIIGFKTLQQIAHAKTARDAAEKFRDTKDVAELNKMMTAMTELSMVADDAQFQAFSQSLEEMIGAPVISTDDSLPEAPKIFSLKGDNNWEYANINQKWHARKLGTQEWKDISGMPAAVERLEAPSALVLKRPGSEADFEFVGPPTPKDLTEPEPGQSFLDFMAGLSSADMVDIEDDEGEVDDLELGIKYSPAEFKSKFGPIIARATENTGLFPSVTLAQMALETGWGKSHAGGKNLFGIKGTGSKTPYWSGDTTTKSTAEVIDGERVMMKEPFRKYSTYEDSVRDRNHLLLNNSRYSAVPDAETPEDQAQAIKDAGYATDPKYVDKIVGIINKYGFEDLDPAPMVAAAKGNQATG